MTYKAYRTYNQNSLMQSQTSLTKKLTTILAATFVFLFLLFFSTAASNPFEIPKKALLFATALLLVIIWAIDGLLKKRTRLTLTPFTLPLVALTLTALISAFLNENPFVASLYGKAGILLAFTLIFIALTSLRLKSLNPLLYSLIGSSFILGWVAVFAYLEILPKILPWPIVSSKVFSPAGPPLTTASFLTIILAVTLFLAIKTKDLLIKISLFITSAVQAVALIFIVSQMLPGQPSAPTLLPFSAGWSIATDMLKSAKNAFIGVGPDNFMAAYTRFKPAFLNLDNKLWLARFNASSSEVLTIFTTLGLLGLAVFLWLMITFAKTAAQVKPAVKLGLGLTFLSFFLLPASLMVWFLIFVFLVLAIQDSPEKCIKIKESKKIPYLPQILNLAIIAVCLFGFYGLLNFIRADLTFAKSLKAASENRGTETYNLQIKAIKLNPYEVNYRIAYSNTNLALANSLALKEDLTGEDRKNISQLVSQAIREAKAAVALAPQNVAVWENLANIYRNLINFAQGADNWAVASYVEAIRLDPINPRLRLDFGGLLYAMENYDKAIDQFKRAIDFKPDYANAYYNLSAAYRENQDFENAYLAMQKVISLIDKESQDFDRANLELANLAKLLPEEVQTATQAAAQKQKQPEALETPQPLPSPKPAGEVKFNPQEQERLAP